MTHRRGPAALGWGLAAFVAGQLLLTTATEVVWPQLRDPLYVDKLERWQHLAAAAPGPTIAFLGSSRTGMAVNGCRLSERMTQHCGQPVLAVNLGVPAGGPITQSLYAERLLRDGPRPDLVVVELLPAMLAGGPHDCPAEEDLLFADRLTWPEVNRLANYQFERREVTSTYALAQSVPAYGRRFTLLTRTSPRLVPWSQRNDWSRSSDSHGWTPGTIRNPTPEIYLHGVARAYTEYYQRLQRLTFDGPACQAVRDTVACCRRHGVPVLLLLMPEGTIFRSWYPPGAEERLKAWLGTFDPADVTILDARPWMPDDAFADSHHLLRGGAEAFSDRLAHALKPFLLGDTP